MSEFKRTSLILLIVGALSSVPSFAQSVEIHPYAGGFFPSTTNPDIGRFRNEGIYGVKAGVMSVYGVELGGNFGYINHFQIRPGSGFWERLNPVDQSSVRGLLWEATGDYNFNAHTIGAKVMPFAGIGLGGLTANVRPSASGSRSIILSSGSSILNANGGTGTRDIVLDNNDSFFMFSYGAGLKATQLWGPVGLRGEVRGRTLPNVFGRQVTWPEVTGGLTFSFGER